MGGMEGWVEKNGRVKKINIDGRVRHNNGADLKWVWGEGEVIHPKVILVT